MVSDSQSMAFDLSQINPNYLIWLNGTDERGNNVDITAATPEEFQLGANSHWEALLPNFSLASLISQQHGESAGGIIQRTTGISLTNSKLAQTRVWAGTDPVTFSLPIVFFALSDAKQDVMYPLKSLMALTMPSLLFSSNNGLGNTGNQLLVRAPGPTVSVAGHSASKYKVSLQIGNTYYFEDVIVTSSPVRHRAVYTQNGEFITASCDLEITTSTIITKEDLDKIFLSGQFSTSDESLF